MNFDKNILLLKDLSVERPVIQNSRRKWVNFDYDNLFPQRCLELVKSSPLQTSILESKKAYIMGSGLKKTDYNIYTPNQFETWTELIEKCIEDYVYLYAMAVQAILNESGTRWSFYYQNVAEIRFEDYDAENHINKAYLCTDWKKANSRNVVEIKMFGSETPKKGEPYLIYFKPHSTGDYYYSIPPFWSAANYISADAALSRYYNNYINNNFSANLVIKFPNEPSEEKKAELYANLKASFGGSDNAGNILLLFGENGSLPDISSIESVNADLYNSVVDLVKLALVSANRLTSPILAGIATSTGFSSKSDEIIAATVQYMLTVISGDRRFIANSFNKLLEMNGLPRCIAFDDYNLQDEFQGKVEENDKKEEEGINVETNNEEDEQQEQQTE